MASVESQLIDRERRLILLLTPPFDKAEPNPGYIKGYVPGVRENGGQYTHAALWVVLAQAMLQRGDAAHELLSFINPIHRSSDRDSVKRYRAEPYVVAADIYSASGHAGRGGWTWYTGAAGWMYRVTIEHILGLRREGNLLTFNPCVPAHWDGYRVTYRIPGAEYVIQVENAEGSGGGVRSLALDGVACGRGSDPSTTQQRTARGPCRPRERRTSNSALASSRSGADATQRAPASGSRPALAWRAREISGLRYRPYAPSERFDRNPVSTSASSTVWQDAPSTPHKRCTCSGRSARPGISMYSDLIL